MLKKIPARYIKAEVEESKFIEKPKKLFNRKNYKSRPHNAVHISNVFLGKLIVQSSLARVVRAEMVAADNSPH